MKNTKRNLAKWKNVPDGRILASDVTVAKNYLGEKEIKKLERTIFGLFDYIENIIESETQLTMQDMADSVDKFLIFNNYKILGEKGCVSKASADKKGLNEYNGFNKIQKIESDFNKLVKLSQNQKIRKRRSNYERNKYRVFIKMHRDIGKVLRVFT